MRTEVQKFDGVSAIIVERFDRYRDKRDSLVKRIHQEDCCQALGVHPNTKYQSEGGPGLPEIMHLLRSTKSPEVDRDRFMRAQVFNFLIGGTDAHAKNYSIIYEPGGAFRLTPLYDVISFLPYQQRRSQLKLAMTIGGRREVDEIRLRHWERAAERCRFSGERIVAHVRELTATLPDLEQARREIKSVKGAQIFSAAIRERLHSLATRYFDQVRPVVFPKRRWETFVRDSGKIFRDYRFILDPYVQIGWQIAPSLNFQSIQRLCRLLHKLP